MAPTKERVSLYLVGSEKGLPTLDELIALARKLTGRDPTPEEIEAARKIYDGGLLRTDGLGIGTSIRTGEHMSEANKALARRLWDVWHSRDLDKLGDLIAEGHVNHDPNNPADLVGIEGYRELITLYTTMFSDLRFEIHNIVAEGDIVCSRWTSVGTHDGEVLGITPTGHSLKRTGMSWQRIERGKFVETWVERDGLGLARDIGAVPPA
jgi:predicted ester cyclase